MVDVADALAGAAKGAAAGTLFGPVGTGVGAAVGLGIQLVPALAKWVFGEGGEQTVAKVQEAVVNATSTTDAAGQEAAIQNAEVKANLVVQLAQIAHERETAHETTELETVRAQLAEVQKARDQQMTFSQSGKLLSWGAPVVSFVILAMWFSTIIARWCGLPDIPVDDGATLRNMSIGVAGFWIGSSIGSVRGGDRLAQSVPVSMLSPPVAVVPANRVIARR